MRTGYYGSLWAGVPPRVDEYRRAPGSPVGSSGLLELRRATKPSRACGRTGDARTRGGGEELDRRANAGLRSCCTTLAHVAVRPTFCSEPLGPLEERGAQVWAGYGPRGGLRPSALAHCGDSGYLPSICVWAVTSLNVSAPLPLLPASAGAPPGVASGISPHAVTRVGATLPADVPMDVPKAKAAPKPPPPAYHRSPGLSARSPSEHGPSP